MQGQEVRLQRQQHLSHRSHRVEREQAERGRAVDDHVVEPSCLRIIRTALCPTPRIGRQTLAEDRLAAVGPGKRQLDGRKVDVGRHHAQRVGHGHAGCRQGLTGREHIKRRRAVGSRHDSDMQRRMRLRIEVDQADVPAGARQRHGEVHRRGGLADSTLLVCHGDGTHAESSSKACWAAGEDRTGPTGSKDRFWGLLYPVMGRTRPP